MKKLNMIIAVFLMMMVNGQETFKYGITGNFHKGSIVGVHDVSKGAFGGSLGIFAQWSLVENDVYDSAWLYLMPQIEYSMQGEIAKAEEDKFGIQQFDHDYVAMQVYLRYFFHQGNMKRDVILHVSFSYSLKGLGSISTGFPTLWLNIIGNKFSGSLKPMHI